MSTPLPSQPTTDRNAGSSALRSLAARVSVALLVGLALLLGCFRLGNYDIWWHLRTGELIPERGIPTGDWYALSSDAPDGPAWIDVHWGFQLVVAWVHRYWGVAGLIVMKALVGALAVAICLTAYRRDWPPAVRAFVWLPALLLLSSRMYVRPEIFTLLFLAIFLSILFHAEERPRLLWLLPLVQVVWCNFQGLWVFGPILLAMYLVEAVLRMDRNHGLFRRLIPVTILTVSAGACSPYRVHNVLFIVELWTRMSDADRGRVFRENIAELTDVKTFLAQGGSNNPYIWMLIALLVLSAVSVLLAWRSILLERRVFRLLPLVAFGWLSLQATRNGNHFALVAGTAICWNLGAAFGARSDDLDRSRLPRRFVEWSGVLAILVVAFMVASGHWYLWTHGGRRAGFGLRAGFYSFEGMRVAGAPDMPTRAAVFHLGQAATYVYANGPEHKVLMDGRLEVHDEPLFDAYRRLSDALAGAADWDRMLRALGIDLVVADGGPKGHRIQATLFVDPKWRCVHYDEVVGVFLRRSTPTPRGVVEFDLRAAPFLRRTALFEAPLPEPTSPPRWWLWPPESIYPTPADFLAERSYFLALSLSPRMSAPIGLRQSASWFAIQRARESIHRRPWRADGRRWFGISCLRLPIRAGAKVNATAPWTLHDGLMPAMGTYALTQALGSDPDDYSSNLALDEHLAGVGALGRSLAPLEKLVQRRPINKTQIELAERMMRDYSDRLERVRQAENSVDPDDLTFDGLERYADAGLIGRGLDRVESEIVEQLPFEEADRVATWFLLIGEPHRARQTYDRWSSANRSTDAGAVPAGLIETRLASCEAVLGRFGEARNWFLEALRKDRDSTDACFGMALLNLLAGDREQMEEYITRGLATRPDAGARAALLRLRTMLEEAP